MIINMNIGGTEKALLNMINNIPRNQYIITIFMLEKYGGFLDHIPSDVHVKYFQNYKNIKDMLNKPPHEVSLDLIKNKKFLTAFLIMLFHIITKALKNRSIYFKYLLSKYPAFNEEYDIAVAYDGPMDFISYFVLKKIKAKKKIQWIHFDVTKIGFNPKFASSIYRKYDNIFVVSNEAKMRLLELVPKLKNKTKAFLNSSSPSLIRKQSKFGVGFTDSFNGIRILTVGRLSDEKGQDLAILALEKLVAEGYNVRWYCVGDGPSRGRYEQLIREKNLKNHFILLGLDPNPYPYIAQSDIYVQPSRHEGFCITLAEAKYLRKPIITTNFAGAKEQITNGENGLIVEINEDEIYKALVNLIQNEDLCEKFSSNLDIGFNEVHDNYITFDRVM
ncbi:glycosyltransferase [Bacillus sp. FJAT-49870]|uniref:Glycosyltransferase n=2 Tax=Lederbergia citri TaxID=2833580 RepID=A0A942YIG8_9BACI|nr:glycosyltransferase [Lederbergia citri]